jgi:hypothetical protein
VFPQATIFLIVPDVHPEIGLVGGEEENLFHRQVSPVFDLLRKVKRIPRK